MTLIFLILRTRICAHPPDFQNADTRSSTRFSERGYALIHLIFERGYALIRESVKGVL